MRGKICDAQLAKFIKGSTAYNVEEVLLNVRYKK